MRTNLNPLLKKLFPSFLIICFLILWLIFLFSYINQTRDFRYINPTDLKGHVKYSELIAAKKQLPGPYEGWLTYHTPLYYLINQAFDPASANHINSVRYASVFYGIVFLVCAFIGMSGFKISKYFQLIIISYFATIPAFVQFFTNYSNDVLVATLAGLQILVSLSYVKKPNALKLLFVFLITILGVYTKYTFFHLIFGIFLAVLFAFLAKKIKFKTLSSLTLALTIGLISLIPYLYFHNYKLTGKFFPKNPENGYWKVEQIKANGGLLSIITNPPGIKEKWNTPFVRTNPLYDKKNFSSLLLSTSLFGEFDYSQEGGVIVIYGWIIFWIEVFLLGFFLVQKGYPKYILGLILGALTVHICQIIYLPFFTVIQWRFYEWVFLPLAIIVGIGLEKNKFNRYALPLLLVGVFIHLLFILELIK